MLKQMLWKTYILVNVVLAYNVNSLLLMAIYLKVTSDADFGLERHKKHTFKLKRMTATELILHVCKQCIINNERTS